MKIRLYASKVQNTLYNPLTRSFHYVTLLPSINQEKTLIQNLYSLLLHKTLHYINNHIWLS